MIPVYRSLEARKCQVILHHCCTIYCKSVAKWTLFFFHLVSNSFSFLERMLVVFFNYLYVFSSFSNVSIFCFFLSHCYCYITLIGSSNIMIVPQKWFYCFPHICKLMLQESIRLRLDRKHPIDEPEASRNVYT